MKLLKRTSYLVLVMSLLSMLLLPLSVNAATFNQNYIITDTDFDFSSRSWSAAQIDAWLNSNFPSGCISGSFRTPDPLGWSSSQNKYVFGGNVTGGKAVYDAAKHYAIDPKVILTTLQKEQSIITGGAGCHPNTPNPATATSMTNKCGSGTRQCTLACTFSGGCMTIAMGNGCPSYCDVRYEGFSMQIITAAWVMRFSEQRAYGRTTGYAGYDTGDEAFSYSGALVAPAGDGRFTTADGHSLHLTNGATSSLYSYTPFISGNSHFFTIYSGWFGNPNTNCFASTNLASTPSGRRIYVNHYLSSKADSLTFTQFNNTGSACTEAHTLSSDYHSWASHAATSLGVSVPNSGEILNSTPVKNSRSNPIYVKYSGADGRTEIHTYSPDYSTWLGHSLTPISGFNPSQGEIITGDMNGDGRSEVLLVLYNGASGHVEIHTLSSDYHSFVGHTATVISGFDPTQGEIITGDMNGDGRDEILQILYNGASGKVEVHTLSSDYRSYVGHAATVVSGFDPST